MGKPVILILKKDEKLGFYVDYHLLNAVTRRDTSPAPRMDERIESLGYANVFSTLDFLSDNLHVKISEKDQDKMMFVTRSVTYRFRRIPFGLKIAPATFQLAVDIILS